MPILGAVTPSGNWRTAVLPIGPVRLGIGDFIGAFIDFVIIAAVIFFIVKNLLKDEPAKA
jgi:large conductance mechanosensitive channel